MTYTEIGRLYLDTAMTVYGAEAVRADLLDGENVPTVCWILLQSPSPGEHNPDLVDKLAVTMAALGATGG